METTTWGWTVFQLPSGADGISFTVHPQVAEGRPIYIRWLEYTDSDCREGDRRTGLFPARPRPLVEGSRP